jgi:hypothetical protein
MRNKIKIRLLEIVIMVLLLGIVGLGICELNYCMG